MRLKAAELSTLNGGGDLIVALKVQLANIISDIWGSGG